MADEERTPYRYKVTVNKWFTYQDVIFRPAEVEGPKKGFPRYLVPPATFLGTIEDGTPFKDLCATVDPEFEQPA
jgi:hypothetical protein